MHTPKSRNSSSGAPQKSSPRSVSLEPTQKASPQAGSAEMSQKVSPRVVRQLKTSPRYFEHTASSINLATKPPKERSPKVSDHRSPKSPAPETTRQSRVSELESQVSQLENDLNVVKDQLCATEASKKQAEKDADEANQRVLALSLKLEESQEKNSDSLASKNEESSREQSQALESESIEEHCSRDSAALGSALDEIAQLKHQLETAAESEAVHLKNYEAAQSEVSRWKEALSETELLVEELKSQLKQTKESEAEALARFEETMMQVENAQKTMDLLRSENVKATEGYEDLASKLEKSRARVDYLEELVSELKAQINVKDSQSEHNEIESAEKGENNERAETEIRSMKLEIQQLTYALEAAEIRYDEEQSRNKEHMTNAFETLEKMKSVSHLRESELESQLQTSKDTIEELKSTLLDKENELQAISEESDALAKKLENNATLKSDREEHLEHELNKSRADLENLKALIMDKENEFLNAIEENKTLKSQVNGTVTASTTDKGKGGDDPNTDIESIRASEREALMKVGYLMEEVDKSNRKVERIAEQLEAAQLTNSEMETELRRIKVQSDQWRKAAEAAAAMISAGNNGQQQLMERSGSMDSHYSNNSPRMKKMSGGGGSPYGDELDEDLMKKKNANVLRRFWKKPQK